MSKSKYQPGDVVWAIVKDRNGVEKPTPRPLLVIPPAADNTEQALCCLCVSTDPKLDPNDPTFELPWDADTGSTTGLYQWCAAVLLWFHTVDQNRVIDRTGHVSNAILAGVIEARNVARFFRPGH